jgi:4-diphosphocytidyl-2-C-methyl-D-erythritol kinase
MAMTEVKAAAKINLFLLVGSRGAGGYHQICSLMDKVSLFDVLRIGRRSTGFTVSGMDIPQSENLISKAVLALERLTGKTLAAEVVVDKHIPLAAGLAGGSSDAAAVMQELARAYGLDLQGNWKDRHWRSERMSPSSSEAGRSWHQGLGS